MTDKSSSAGSGFTGLLFLVFLTLKLCGVIDWSWWWITAPLWGPLIICALILLGMLLYYWLVPKRKRGNV